MKNYRSDSDNHALKRREVSADWSSKRFSQNLELD